MAFEIENGMLKKYIPVKYAILVGVFLETCDKDIEAYITDNFTEIFKCFIDEDDIATIHNLISQYKFINEKNVDELFEYANDNQKTEIKLMLMNYKYEHIGMTKKKIFEI